jgi:hypothetical protein
MKSAFIYDTLVVIISDVGCHIYKMDGSYEMAYQIKVAINSAATVESEGCQLCLMNTIVITGAQHIPHDML